MSDAPAKRCRAGDAIFVSVFAAILCSAMLAKAFGIRDLELVEKRALASAPGWPKSLEDWKKLTASVDQYANDHFGVRGALISTESYLRYRMGLSSYARVLVGEDGWLFYIGDPEFKFFRGIKLSAGQEQEWMARMKERQEWLAARGIRFVVLPAPVKETVYPEYLPDWLRQQAGSTLVDQLVADSRGQLPVIDVRARLRERKKEVPVYGRFDTHWNFEGAFIGYSAIGEQLSMNFLKRDSFTLQPMPPEHLQRDLALMLGVHPFVNIEGLEYRPSHNVQTRFTTPRTDPDSPVIIRSGLENTPTLMIIGDSFSRPMLPYLEDTFGTIVWRHLQDGFFPRDEIEKYHPDVLMIEVQEAGFGAL